MKTSEKKNKQSRLKRKKLVIIIWLMVISTVVIIDNLSLENLEKIIDNDQWIDLRPYLLIIFGILTGILLVIPGKERQKPSTTKFCPHCYAENPIGQEQCLDCENRM